MRDGQTLEEWELSGEPLSLNFEIRRQGVPIVRAKRNFSMFDLYSVELVPGLDEQLVFAIISV